MDTIKWIQEWYKSNCDGYWEHMYGLKLTTLDNPGWAVEIDLSDTNVEEKAFERIQYDNGDEDWILCYVKDGVYNGNGDPDKLLEIFAIFKKWVEQGK